ncbi:alpha/beta fold hydrolase [Leptothoe sp. PORK10 BA2]|uniref:alpha/beta fold hydrolase n=1 Tax=Leptothoe sp. PORK10 BA2 TaxID=3110254 RepID=UPI002B21F70C|nr:hypothetical protein [Leptothoe sp. PORK10 BA2]MEA5462809.1 hypothetical protein [Leptothoe sp. PORK10 BA2]
MMFKELMNTAENSLKLTNVVLTSTGNLVEGLTSTSLDLVNNLAETLNGKIQQIEQIRLKHPMYGSLEVNFADKTYALDAAISESKRLTKDDPHQAKALLQQIVTTMHEGVNAQDNLTPDVIIFSQHGMTDDNTDMVNLAAQLQVPQSYIVAPNLGWLNTVVDFQGLLETVETSATEAFQRYPDTPARILAVSLGGILWIEALSRHREWWPRIESLVLLGVPIGGAHLARMVDPFGWGIGIAKPLGQNRRPLAETITAEIPTLVIAGDMFQKGYDMVVPVETTKLNHAHFVCLNNVTHKQLKMHSDVVKTIQNFWTEPQEPLPANPKSLVTDVVDYFRQVNGMTNSSQRYLKKAKTQIHLTDGTTIRTYTNGAGVKHVFVVDIDDQCRFSGYVGWVHTAGLDDAIKQSCSLFNNL